MEKNMKTAGIIGGLGPETTAKFYLEIVNSCLKNNKKQRPPMLIWNVPVLLKEEKELITNNISGKDWLPLLLKAAVTLEKAGADFLVIPCNTVHIFIEDIRKAVKIPILSIVDETIVVTKKQKISKIGILSTSTTISKKLFEDKLRNAGIKTEIPDKRSQQKLDRIIHGLILGRASLQDEIETDKIITKMVRQGVKNILLACTDLQLIVKEKVDVEIFDTMQILANATVRSLERR